MTLLLIILAYTFLNIALAAYDAARIKDNEKIYHTVNAVQYLIFLIPAWCVTGNWVLLIGLLALRRVVFDIALNLFRGLPFNYISPTTDSVIDRWSYKLQEKYGWKLYYGVFVLIIILSIFPYGKS